MTHIAANQGLAQVVQNFLIKSKDSGNVSTSSLKSLLKSVRQSPLTTLSRPERETLKRDYHSIEKLNCKQPASKRGGASLLREIIWQVSESRQGLGSSHSDKVTKKEISALQTSAKKFGTATKLLREGVKKGSLSVFESPDTTQLRKDLSLLKDKVSEIEKKFTSSKVSQKNPNMNKAKAIEALSKNIASLTKNISDIDREIGYESLVQKNHDAKQACAVKHQYDPKGEKSYLGDGNS